MTVQEIIREIHTLSLDECRELMRVLGDIVTTSEAAQQAERLPGLHAGTTWVSADFDEPLPDGFWMGEE